MNKKFLGALMLAALFSTAGAMAQEKTAEQPKAVKGEKLKKEAKHKIEDLDTDKDGKISKDEAGKKPDGKLNKNFTAIDKNKDNYLDKDEMKAYKEEKKAASQEKKTLKKEKKVKAE